MATNFDIDGSSPSAFGKMKARRKFPEKKIGEGVLGALTYQDAPVKPNQAPALSPVGKKIAPLLKNSESEPYEWKPVITVFPKQPSNPLELGLDWRYSKKVNFPPIQTSPPQQEKPRGLKRVDPPKQIDADSIPRGRKHIEQLPKPETQLEETVGRRKKIEVKGELEKPFESTNNNFTKQILHQVAVSRFQFRQPTTDNFLAEQQRREALEEWRKSQQVSQAHQETQEDIAATKTLDKWEEAHLPKKVEKLPSPVKTTKGKKGRATATASTNKKKPTASNNNKKH